MGRNGLLDSNARAKIPASSGDKQMPRRQKSIVPRSFRLTMSMRTYNDLQTILSHVFDSSRGDLRRRSAMVRKRLEKALKRATA